MADSSSSGRPKIDKAFNVDDIIIRLLSVGRPGQDLIKTIKENEIIQLCHNAKQSFLSQPPLIEIEPPVKICGDTHGQYSDSLRLFDRGFFPPMSNYLFLSDYVDRGLQNIENICLFFAYKVRNPSNFFLLRGNHECAAINRVYGFYEECTRRYRSGRLWNIFQDTFNTMPLAALVGGRILCMHGGLSPCLHSLDQLRSIVRPLDPPNPSLHLDLLWSDPESDFKARDFSPPWIWMATQFTWRLACLRRTESCKELGIDLIARAHQVVQDGYEFFANRQLVTIFSAPHYCGQFDNAAAIMSVDKNLACSFMVLRAASKSHRVVRGRSDSF